MGVVYPIGVQSGKNSEEKGIAALFCQDTMHGSRVLACGADMGSQLSRLWRSVK